ncbi:MAG: hypothetical protein HYV63_31900 [Candidatus Schekmanbacteria bacterium]|nr:hypothetical protein [Candidatus Schekmanbacteria bacterium]
MSPRVHYAEMLAFANGQLTASSLYDLATVPNDPSSGEATHHHLGPMNRAPAHRSLRREEEQRTTPDIRPTPKYLPMKEGALSR